MENKQAVVAGKDTEPGLDPSSVLLNDWSSGSSLGEGITFVTIQGEGQAD